MEATGTAPSGISREKFRSFVSTFVSRPNPDGDPTPPGPWDPVIRQTERMFGPSPDPWRSGIDEVALNPQPLPPESAFAVEFIRNAADRLVLIQETADAINDGGEERGIIIVGGRVSELVDFVCGNIPRRFPPRPPRGDDDPRLTGQELVLMGAELLRYSKSIANEGLGQEFAAAGEQLIDVGIERL